MKSLSPNIGHPISRPAAVLKDWAGHYSLYCPRLTILEPSVHLFAQSRTIIVSWCDYTVQNKSDYSKYLSLLWKCRNLPLFAWDQGHCLSSQHQNQGLDFQSHIRQVVTYLNPQGRQLLLHQVWVVLRDFFLQFRSFI